MRDTSRSGPLRELFRAARAAARRQRINAALRRLLLLLPLPLASGALGLAIVKWSEPSPDVVELLAHGFLLSLLVPLVGAISGWRSLASHWKRRGALALDRHHGSADRIASALEFSELPPEQRSPLMEAAISDALRAVERPSPARAVPISLPRAAWVSVGLGVLLVAVGRLPPARAPELSPIPAPVPIDPVALAEDDVALLRESMEELSSGQDNPELTRAIADFNQLVEQLADRQIDRRQLFQRLADIERSLGSGSGIDPAVEESLREIASELEKSPLSRPVAEALKQRQLPDAERALRELADRLAREDKPSRAELERLRKALQAAAEQSSGRVQRLEEARQRLEREQNRLLKKKGRQDPTGARDSATAENRRRLERLERERQGAQRAQQELSQLDRDLAKAAQELMRELGQSAESLRSGAEDVHRMARKQMTEREKQELKRRLEELKELLRQGGQGREQHLRRLRQFAERARGKQGKGSSGGEPGKGQPGQGDGAKRTELVLGPGGQPIPLPQPGSSPAGARPGAGEGQGKPEEDRREWGSGSDPNLKGTATDLDGKTMDVAAAAVDTGQGSASSEVVFGAAERGFTGARYQDVYTQYRTVAEDVLEQETIPAGYEFYVRRYFQLIRPRTAP